GGGGGGRASGEGGPAGTDFGRYRSRPGRLIVAGMTAASVPVQRGLVPAWLVDLTLFLLGAVFAAGIVFDGVERHLDPVPLAVDAVLGAVSCAGIALRRRWPVGFAVVVGVFSVYALSAALVSLIALYTVAACRRFAVVAPVAVGYVLVSPLTTLVRPDLAPANGYQVLLQIVCVAAVVAWGMYVRARRPLLGPLRERAPPAQA